MKKFISILSAAWILGYSLAFAIDIAVVDGPGGFARDGDYIRVQNPGQDQVIIDDLNISEDSNFPTVAGQVTGVYGVHTHDYGADACLIEARTSNTVKLNNCTIHINGGIEYDFNSTAFPAITSIALPYSSSFIGINGSGLVIQDTFFTDTDVTTTLQLARVQETQSGLSIIDLRNIVTEVDRKNFIYKRDAIGPVVTLDGGLIVSESGTRNLDMTAGDFLDEENELHRLSAFSAMSGLTLYRTTAAFDSWTTTAGGRGLLQVDNINYNDITSGGLVPAQNNNKYILMNLYISESGGEVNGADTGRDPTFFLFYGTDEYDSLELARNSIIDIGSFQNAKPNLMPIARLILRKNQAAIEDFFDIRPFITRIAGTASAIQTTASLQTVYDNSPNSGIPEIKTNDQNEDVTIQYEGTNGKIAEFQNLTGGAVFTVWTSHVTTSDNFLGLGKIVQVVNVEDGEVSTGTTIIPYDDTIPQNTEGDEYMTLSITPKNAANKLLIQVVFNAYVSTTGSYLTALFQDSTANALAAVVEGNDGLRSYQTHLIHYMTAGTTSTTTFKVRAGKSQAGTLTFNGVSGLRRLGGVSASSITITEISQ